MENWSNILILVLTLVAIIGGQAIKFTKKKAAEYDESVNTPELEEEYHHNFERPEQLIDDDPYSFGNDTQSLESIPDISGYKSLEDKRTNNAFDYNKYLRDKNSAVSSISSKIKQQQEAEAAANNDNTPSGQDKDSIEEIFNAKKAVIYSEILKPKF